MLWAKNAAIARAMLENNMPGIILMDSSFAAAAGDGMLHDLRESEGSQKIPVLILTTAAQGRDAAQCLVSGVTDYIAKPLERVSLYEKVRDILNERALCLKG